MEALFKIHFSVVTALAFIPGFTLFNKEALNLRKSKHASGRDIREHAEFEWKTTADIRYAILTPVIRLIEVLNAFRLSGPETFLTIDQCCPIKISSPTAHENVLRKSQDQADFLALQLHKCNYQTDAFYSSLEPIILDAHPP
jgi:hypothetical protein